MKKILIVFAKIVSAIKGMAQTAKPGVFGSMVYTKNAPVESATISLLNPIDMELPIGETYRDAVQQLVKRKF